VVESSGEAFLPVGGAGRIRASGLDSPGEEGADLVLALGHELLVALPKRGDDGARVGIGRVRLPGELYGVTVACRVFGQLGIDVSERTLCVVEPVLEVFDERRLQQGGEHLVLLGVVGLALRSYALSQGLSR